MGGRGSAGGPGPGSGTSSTKGKVVGFGSGYVGKGGGSSAGSSGGSFGKGNASAGTGGIQTGGGNGSGGGSAGPQFPQPNNGKKVFTSGYKAREWFASIWPSKDKYAPAIRQEYATYSTNIGYQSINTTLRAINGDVQVLYNNPSMPLYNYDGTPLNYTPSQMAQRIATMDAGMEFAPRVPEWIELSRGTRLDEFKNLGITSASTDADIKALLGKTYTNHSYTSTSVGGKAAMDWMPVQISVNVPPGMKGVHMAGNASYSGALSTLASENEFLLPRGTKFKITKIKKVNGNWIISVEALLP